MKIFYVFLISFLFSINLNAQYPPNPNFEGLTSGPCPFDSTVTINQTDFWLVYQTLDDKWDGEIDSTRCISLEEVGNNLDIALDQIDPAKPFFVKSLMDDDAKVLLNKNSLFNALFVFSVSDGMTLNLNEDCENGLCTGMMVGIEIPDSTGSEKSLRTYNTTVVETTFCDATFCYSTEKFDENYLKEFVLKVTLENQDVSGHWLRLSYVSNDEFDSWEDYRIYDLPIPEFTFDGSSYNVNLWDIGIYDGNALLMYTDTTYPSAAHKSYIDAHLVSNKPSQQTINFCMEMYHLLIFQPFVELRGGLIEGNDSVRHVVNLINNEGEICVNNFVELIFDGNNYVHQGGDVEFHGTTSCMLFKNGGTLFVRENTTFNYGNGGEGMLAICNESTINIEKGGILEIDNHMVLKSNGDKEDQQVFMELNPGSTLRFGENAKLSHIGVNPEMRLNVYMNGGVLDDHLLSETERRLINKIYPKPDDQNNFKLYPNPAVENCIVSVILENEGNLSFKMVDMNGRLIQSFNEIAEKGYNEISLGLDRIPKGIYFLRIESDEFNSCQKLIKL